MTPENERLYHMLGLMVLQHCQFVNPDGTSYYYHMCCHPDEAAFDLLETAGLMEGGAYERYQFTPAWDALDRRLACGESREEVPS